MDDDVMSNTERKLTGGVVLALGWMLLFVGLVDISAEDEAKAAEAKKKQYSLLGSISPTLRNQIEETTFLVNLSERNALSVITTDRGILGPP
eukprot:1823576-Rhodomonas_salina.2